MLSSRRRIILLNNLPPTDSNPPKKDTLKHLFSKMILEKSVKSRNTYGESSVLQQYWVFNSEYFGKPMVPYKLDMERVVEFHVDGV